MELLSLLQIGRVVPARPGERARHAEDGGGGQDRGRLRGPHAAREGPHAEAQRGADRGTVQASLMITASTRLLVNFVAGSTHILRLVSEHPMPVG